MVAFSWQIPAVDCFHLFKSVSRPLFSPPTCVNALQLHKKREAAVAAPLQANEGYLELEKLSASIPFPPRVIFYPWRGNDPEVLLYTWYVEVIVPGYLLSVINSAKCVENILKWYNKTENSSVCFIATDKYWLCWWLPEQVNTDVSCSQLPWFCTKRVMCEWKHGATPVC